MTRHLHSGRLASTLVTFLAITLFFMLATAITTFAELSSEDIDALREQGRTKGWTFTVDKNPATEYSLPELTGLVIPEGWEETAKFDPMVSKRSLPEKFDWRELDGTTPVRNQGGCGSCWAFSTVGALECAIKIRDGIDVDLSEQWLVSCNTNGWGCEGGWYAHDYHQWRTDVCGGTGAVLESDFHYFAADGVCNCPYDHHYTHNGWAYIGPENGVPSVNAMKTAIVEYGPISVAVAAGDAMQAYSGGVFNANASEINHAVVLVGWDDSQGTNGVWIMRNSWGSYWGEAGYMRIEYGKSQIGYGACYIDYDIYGVSFTAEPAYGNVPLSVDFEGFTSFEADSWSWDFGDGGSSNLQAPTHVYTAPGLYNVTVEINVNGDIYNVTRDDYVKALADTMSANSAEGGVGESVEIVVWGKNSVPLYEIRIPFEYPGNVSLARDSFSTAGCRTEGFDVVDLVHSDAWNSRYTFRVKNTTESSVPDLAPGAGPILKVYMGIHSSATPGQTADIFLDGYDERLPQFSGMAITYVTSSVPGAITVTGPVCSVRGDFDHNGQVDVSDIVGWINWSFNGGDPPVVQSELDMDNSGQVDVGDIVYWIRWSFDGGPEPLPCP